MPDDLVDGMPGRTDPVQSRSRSNRTVTPAIAAALVVLAASFALSVAFVLANGGLDLPAAEGPSSSPAGAGGAASPAASSSAVAGVSLPPSSGEPEASPTSAAASATPTGTATPTPRATPKPTTRPSSNRYDLLTECPGTPDCWVYVVREGDNLFSIARYFGVPLDVVEARNPWTKTTQLVAGQKLLLPPPTR